MQAIWWIFGENGGGLYKNMGHNMASVFRIAVWSYKI